MPFFSFLHLKETLEEDVLGYVLYAHTHVFLHFNYMTKVRL